MALTQEDLQAIAGLLQPIQGEIQAMKGEIQAMKGEIQAIKGEVQAIKGEVQAIKEDVQELARRTTNIELTLENETNRNIKIIAEGHLDLSRKLDDALKVENEKELLLIRVNILENELRKVKERLAQIA
ncbi:DUF5320 domain-containing protein [Acetatifactor aquisgranensis]|uniref:DUF5320 domain-containing protein n=1 Tax=Acetatifactor aquisgranensis TaxID=2941233 RepID=UPI00203D76CC|nr:DUF5320 domain-containing protein [Acetatifactor aquisgranensis]MCI8543523.1 DUF5320 domain-containing protein [Lachnospiraceae bacterium]